jgi:hypothetical protein
MQLGDCGHPGLSHSTEQRRSWDRPNRKGVDRAHKKGLKLDYRGPSSCPVAATVRVHSPQQWQLLDMHMRLH